MIQTLIQAKNSENTMKTLKPRKNTLIPAFKHTENIKTLIEKQKQP